MPWRISYSALRPSLVIILISALKEELYPSNDASHLAFVPQSKAGEDLLASALSLPSQYYYKGTLRKAAVLLRSLVKNHPFIDGNKRFALFMVTLFLATNKFVLLSPKDEAVSFLLSVAREDELSIFRIERWLSRFCLYLRPKKSARRKLRKMAIKYRGDLTSLKSTLREWERTVAAIQKHLDRIVSN